MSTTETLTPPYALLLFPVLPKQTDFNAIKKLLEIPLSSAIHSLLGVTNRSSRAAILDIAVPCSHLAGQSHTPRSSLFDHTQKVLAALYTLASIICARDQIDTQDASGINIRFLLLAHSSDQPAVEILDQDSVELAQGPIINLATLAHSRRNWAYLYTVDGHEGDRIFQEFSSFTALVFKSGTPWEHEKLRSGVSISDVSEMHPNAEAQRHYAVAVGGTFDNLHAGHKLLLSMTAFLVDGQVDEQERRLIVGITGDELLKNKKHHAYLQSWEDRQRGVSDYLEAILDFRPPGQKSAREPSTTTPVTEERARSVVLPHKLTIECVEISDPFGPTITDPAISALVVSGETRNGGKAVNDKREAKGWPSLEVFEVDVLNAYLEDEPSAEMRASYEGKIGSTEIRRQKSERARAKAAG